MAIADARGAMFREAAWVALGGIGAMFIGGAIPIGLVGLPALWFLPDDARYALQVLALAAGPFVGSIVAARGGLVGVGPYAVFLLSLGVLSTVHSIAALELLRRQPCCTILTNWSLPEGVALSYAATFLALLLGLAVAATLRRSLTLALGLFEAAGAFALIAIAVGLPFELLARPDSYVEPRLIPYQIAGTPATPAAPLVLMVSAAAAIAAGLAIGLRSRHVLRDALVISITSVVPAAILQVGLDRLYANTDWHLGLELVPAATAAVSIGVAVVVRRWTRGARHAGAA